MPTKIIYFPNLLYNCEKPYYPLTSLPDSIIAKGMVFAFKNTKISGFKKNGVLAIALVLNSNVDDTNYYKSIERLKNLVCLSYTSMPSELILENTHKTIQEAVDSNLADHFYDPKVRFGGQLDWDLPLRIATYSQNIAKLSNINQTKFWQALQTFSYARLIAYLPNPQYKYTLYMTLHLASINQLAEKPKNLHNPAGHLMCVECKEQLNSTHQTSHIDEIVKLIEKLIPIEHQKRHIKFMKKLFHPIRSEFIHEGNFAGKEDLGGFIGLWGDPSTNQLSESDINLMIFNRSLLEQFLEKYKI